MMMMMMKLSYRIYVTAAWMIIVDAAKLGQYYEAILETNWHISLSTNKRAREVQVLSCLLAALHYQVAKLGRQGSDSICFSTGACVDAPKPDIIDTAQGYWVTDGK